MSIRRVLMTGDTVGGVWTFTIALAREFEKQNIEVALLTMGAMPSEAQMAEAAAIPNLCLLPSAWKLEWMEDPWPDVEKAREWIRDVAVEYGPDVIHFNSFGQGNLQWGAPAVLTAHSCVRTWWKAVHGETAPAAWDRYSSLVQDALNAADLVTVPSRSLGAAMQAEYAHFPEFQVIPNGCDSAEFDAARAPESTSDPFIFSAGRLWDEAKNLDALARIAQDLSWPVYIAGETGTKDARGCHPLSRLSPSEMRDWYTRASIYALPARYEPFGLSILEAALCGCALVIGDIPSLREIWEDAAIYVEPSDSASLLCALQQLTGNDALRVEMAERAGKRAEQFTASRTAELYLGAYEQAVRKRRSVCVS